MKTSTDSRTYIAVPNELKEEKRWCLYKIIEREGKSTKLPIMPNSKPAKSNDKSTWHSYEDCMKALSQHIGDGLGFFLGDGYIGIDIDKVSDDIMEYMADKEANSMTADFLRGISTYAEISPSNKGLHFIGKGKVPGERKRHKNLEIYDEGRFFTVTGNVLNDRDRSRIKNIEQELLPLYQKYMPDTGNQREEKETRNNTITRKRESSFIQRYKQSSDDVLDLLFERGYFHYAREDIRQIYHGNYEAYFSSQSEADFFMLQRLLYYTADVGQAVLLMENSGLKREKWYQKRAGKDHIQYIANKAINAMNKFYDWNNTHKFNVKNTEDSKIKENKSNQNEEKEHKYNNSTNQKKEEAMPRYSMEKISDILSHSLEEIRHDQEAYQDFLRTMGNNYKYPYIHQLSIYSTYKDSTACAEYDFWTSIGRVVKRGEHGIPVLDVNGNKARIKYIFDVSQTVSRGNQINEIKLWKYDVKKHLPAIDHLIDSFKEKNSSLLFSQEEKLSSLISLYTKREFYSMVDILTDDTLRRYTKIELSQFIQESLKVAIAQRMGIELPIDETKFHMLSGIVYEQDIDSLLGDISSLAREILIDIGREIGKINEREKLEEIQKKEQTKKDKERYNSLTEKTYQKENKKIDTELKGDLEDERNSSIGKQGISIGGRNLYSDHQGKSIRETGRNLPIREDGSGRGSSDTKPSDAGRDRPEQAQSVWEREAKISQGEQRKQVSNHVLQGNFDESSVGDSRASGEIRRYTTAEDDGSVGIDQSAQVGRFSEVHRTEEKFGYDPHKDGIGTNRLGIENETQEISKEEGEVQATSFSFATNTGSQGRFQLPLRQEEIDTILIYGGNEDYLRLKVLAEYSKGKGIEEMAHFLQKNFQGGNGYEVEGNKVCAWYDKEGIYLANDISSKENPSQILSWIDAANRIEELIEKGQYATNVEVAEAFSHERKELAELLWFLKKDLADEAKQSYLSLLNQTEKSGFPDQTEELTEKLSSTEFRNTLKEEYETFLQDYDTDSSILRFHYHKLNDILQRLQDLEILRKELTSRLTEIPNIKSFITEDEIDENLRRGSGISEGKERIMAFFGKSHTLQEKMDFLKNEYGTGGRSHALSGARGSSEWHDAKGIKLEKENCKDVMLNWNMIAKRLDKLIEQQRYMDEEKIANPTHIEQNIQEQNPKQANGVPSTKDTDDDFFDKDIQTTQTPISHNPDNYWIVTYHEDSRLIEKDYENQILTKEILDEIKALDEKIWLNNNTAGLDEHGNITDEWDGYSKFYFDHIIDGKEVQHYRIDIGDGNEVNQRAYAYLYGQIQKSQVQSLELKDGQDKEINPSERKADETEKIAVKVGNYYAVVNQDKVKDVSLEETGTKVYPSNDNLEGKVYPLYKGKTFEESTKIDALFDEMAASMKESNLTDLKDIFYLEKQGLYEISSDKVTEQKEDFDFEAISFNAQFPDYANEIYIYNKNLKIDDTYQNIAYINRENEIHFNVNLSEEEKAKVLELRDKKEILSTLIFKEIKELGEYHFDPQSEEFILDVIGISEEELEAPKHIADNIDEKEGYEAELVLDMKNKQLRQNLKYSGYILQSNLAIQYDSYQEMLQNLPYLLDDNHRNVMLTGYVHQQIERANAGKNEQAKEPIYQEGMQVKYQGKEYIISEIQEYGSYKTIKLDDNERYLNGFITGSEIIPFRNEGELDLEIVSTTEKLQEQSINDEDFVLLDIKDYNKQGLSVIFKDKECEITGNEFNPIGMSRLQLLSKEKDVVTDIVYTQGRPVANLYAKREFLEPFQLNENESERNIETKQMTLMDMFGKDEVMPIKEEFFQAEETQKAKEELKKEKSYPNEEYMGGIPPINYKITREDEVLPPSERLKNNIKAIKVLNLLEEEHRHATKEEQDILSRYVGWGGLSDVFDEEKQGQWQEARDFLKENLSQSEYDAARESTLTAFYTPKIVIDSIYQALSNMGFESGNILEPSMGSGSTLVACEQLSRCCYMMEYDPKYVDIIINRWENLTGKRAIKLE